MQLSSRSGSVNFCLNHHRRPYYMYASKESPEETVRVQGRASSSARSLQVFTHEKSTNLYMNWLINFHNINPLSDDSLTRTFANSEEPGEILHNVTYHQGHHCL